PAVWNLPVEAPLEWTACLVNCPADRVRRELRSGQHVYLLIINTPDDCVIGGERDAVEEFVARLGASYIPIPAVTIAHCELVMPVSAEYRNLHLLPTCAPKGIRFYSGAWGAAYDVTAESAAAAIV